MKYTSLKTSLVVLSALVLFCTAAMNPVRTSKPDQQPKISHYLYVTTPGIRNYLEYGGHGILVYDMDNNFKLVKRIATAGLDSAGKPSNVKGVCVSLSTQSIYIST